VRLVEDDDVVEIALGRAQRGVGAEYYACFELDRRSPGEIASAAGRKAAALAERRQIALGVLDQLVGLGNPQRLAPPF
jgi:hypothetical protein